MQVHSIISNTISEDTLKTGHLSIRFMTDGFSLLLEDQSYTPVLLNKFTNTQNLSKKSVFAACEDWLETHTILESFKGELTIISDSLASTLVPKDFFDKELLRNYLEGTAQVFTTDVVKKRKLKKRPFVIVHAIPAAVYGMKEKFSGNIRFLPLSQVLLSVADQVNAATHQRGFALVEVQNGQYNILIIKDDNVQLLNQMKLRSMQEMVYHTLNTLNQTGFNRKEGPLYIAGIPRDEELQMLKKYVRTVEPLQYPIPDIDKSAISEHILLAEATKCE